MQTALLSMCSGRGPARTERSMHVTPLTQPLTAGPRAIRAAPGARPARPRAPSERRRAAPAAASSRPDPPRRSRPAPCCSQARRTARARLRCLQTLAPAAVRCLRGVLARRRSPRRPQGSLPRGTARPLHQQRRQRWRPRTLPRCCGRGPGLRCCGATRGRACRPQWTPGADRRRAAAARTGS
jgi:hypothetical protein